MYSLEKVLEGLKKLFPRYEVYISENDVIIERSLSQDILTKISCSSIENSILLMTELHLNFTNEYMICNSQYLETPIKVETSPLHFPIRMMLEDRNGFTTEDQNIKFSIHKASEYYLIGFLCNLNDDIVNTWDRPVLSRTMHGDLPISNLADLSEILRLFTVSINSIKDISTNQQKRLINSFLFNISYNYNIVISMLSFEKKDKLRYRRPNIGQLFPYRFYNPLLTKYYYQGVISQLPFSQYLSFYHIAEFFFHKLIKEDAIKQVQDFVTVPSFSMNKKDDVDRLIHKIQKITKDQKNDDAWSEDKGLLLCLQMYVPDLSRLEQAISAIDPSAVQYYKTEIVPFAEKSDNINFDNPNSTQVYLSIRNRIYSVRNAIVHSKEGEMLKYEPFKHDKALMKEVPLIRAVAEEIIINYSQIWDL